MGEARIDASNNACVRVRLAGVAARRRRAAVERSDLRRDGGERERARRVARRRALPRW